MLPEIDLNALGARDVFSFNRAGLELLGMYTPGKSADLIDPLWTHALVPRAVMAHEETHQQLGENTSYGIFTQFAQHLVARGFTDSIYRTCHADQWKVQELAAVYAELCVVASEEPQQLARVLDDLPSSGRGQPPYRELYESIAPWLPITVDQDRSRIGIQGMLVKAVSALSMHTDCLVRVTTCEFTDEGLLACVQDRPNLRFNRLMGALIGSGTLNDLLDRVKAEVGADADGLSSVQLGTALDLVLTHVVNVAIDVSIPPIDAFHDDVDAASERWNKELTRAGKEPFFPPLAPTLPAIRFAEAAGLESLEFRAPTYWSGQDLYAKLTAYGDPSVGLEAELSVAPNGVVLVILKPYVRTVGDEWLPMVNALPTFKSDDDPSGYVDLADVAEQFSKFPDLPQIVTFFSNSWRRIRHLKDRYFSSRVQICQALDVSSEDVLSLLEFVGLEQGGQYSIWQSPESEVYTGVLLNPNLRNSYSMVRLPSTTSVDVFLNICAHLSITEGSEFDSRERVLLTFLSFG